MSVPSIEMMINVSSDISQLITSYPIDSLPRFPALLSFNKLILSSSLSSSSCSVFSSPHGFFMFLYFIHCEHPETHFPYSTHSLPPGLTISPPLKANSSIFRQCPTSRVTLAFASRSWFHCSQFVERIEKKEKKGTRNELKFMLEFLICICQWNGWNQLLIMTNCFFIITVRKCCSVCYFSVNRLQRVLVLLSV